MKFLLGRPLDRDELDSIRQQIEDFDTIEVIDAVVRGIVKRNWPHLLAKLPPEDADSQLHRCQKGLTTADRPAGGAHHRAGDANWLSVG